MSRNVLRILLFAVFIVVVMLLYYADNSDTSFTFAILDVGQGQCIVFQTPAGKTVLMDCGSTSGRNAGKYAANTAQDYLRSKGVNHLDLVILSHPHEDHMNGLITVLEEMPTDVALDIGAESASPTYIKFLQTIKNNNISYESAKRGKTAQLDENTEIEILHPDANNVYSDLNESSIVARVRHGKIIFMVMSDAGNRAEQEIMREYANLKANVLVVGHHGSKTGSSIEWLNAVKPDVAVISVGKNNKYRLPSKEVLLRLDELKVKVYRTDVDGAVVFSTDGRVLRAKTYAKL